MRKSNRAGIIVKLKLVILFSGLLTACQVADAQRQSADFVSFEKFILDDAMGGGSGVVLADVDGDDLTDIVAFSNNPAQFAWYKNPTWQKYVISSVTQQNIYSAPHDIDGDGDVDIVLANQFSLGEPADDGLLQWFENPGNPAENQQWTVHYIDEVPTTHRIKWGDINGDGQKELVILPIVGFGATSPDYDVDLTLMAYSVPDNLDIDSWPGIVLDQSLQVAHGIDIMDWDGDGRDDILTASFYGVHLFQLASRGQPVAKMQIGEGKQDAARPEVGSSEVDVGSLSDDTRFVATIEPWHGNQVVVYTQGEDSSQPWDRVVIETVISNGHGLFTADLNNDGVDEIIAGGRSEPYQLAIYQNTGEVSSWQRIDLDVGGVAVNGLAIEDLNGDGFTDIVAIGSATGNVVYYRNSGR